MCALEMRSSYGLYTLWMHATLYLLVWSLRYSNVLLPVTANTGDSYAGVLLNYTALYKREMKDWYLISWDSKRQIPLRHRFNPEDRDMHPYPKHYCLAPLSGQPDFLVDAIEPGPDVPTFGVPSKYTLQEYRVLQNMTTDAGIVRGMLKVGFSLQNMAMMDMWGSTLFTWRLRDDRRQDKVMYAFGKRDPSLPPNEQWGMDHMGNPDWIEMRMVGNLAANWPLLGEDMRLFKSPTTGRLWASWCSNYRVRVCVCLSLYLSVCVCLSPLPNNHSLTHSIMPLPTHKHRCIASTTESCGCPRVRRVRITKQGPRRRCTSTSPPSTSPLSTKTLRAGRRTGSCSSIIAPSCSSPRYTPCV